MNHIPVLGRTSPQYAPLPIRVGIVVNPLSNHASSAISEIVRQCRDSNIETPRAYTTSAEDPGEGQARQCVADGADLVIAIGGDGTVREVAEALAGTDVRLGIIALGTGNVLASNLGLTKLSVGQQVATALRGPHTSLDLGQAHMRTTSGEQQVDVIYRRLDDAFLDPLEMRPDPASGRDPATLVPGTDFYAQGQHGQYIFVAPRQRTVVVRLGTDRRPGTWWPGVLGRIARSGLDGTEPGVEALSAR